MTNREKITPLMVLKHSHRVEDHRMKNSMDGQCSSVSIAHILFYWEINDRFPNIRTYTFNSKGIGYTTR